ncbi:MAG: amidohydrolase family protein [candidate division Zixibacteria bacterium]|nr:amidohydrolase family protein [candidate division Zixibacteria bacterium]
MRQTIALLFVAIMTVPAFASSAQHLVLTGGTVIDVSDLGQSRSDMSDAVIIVNGDSIEAIGTGKTLAVPADATVIDITGKYVLPGLIDGYGSIESQAYANAYLYMGVTSVLVLPGYRRGQLFDGAQPAPNIYLYGDVGHFEVSTDEMIRQIENFAEKGVKHIVLMYALKPDQVAVAVKKARELGMTTICEVIGISYKDAAAYGADAFLHFVRYSVELAPPDLRERLAKGIFKEAEREYRVWLAELDPADQNVTAYADFLASSSIALIPTLAVSCIDAPFLDNPWKEAAATILTPADIHNPLDLKTGKHYGPDKMDLVARAIQNFLDIETRYCKAGARYLAGSGTDINGTMPGISLHQELELLVRVGLTTRQALAAATSNFPDLLGLDNVGKLTPGFRADLVVTNRNPVESIKNLKDIHLLVLGGKVMDRDSMLIL